MVGKSAASLQNQKIVIPECFCRGPRDLMHQSHGAGLTSFAVEKHFRLSGNDDALLMLQTR